MAETHLLQLVELVAQQQIVLEQQNLLAGTEVQQEALVQALLAAVDQQGRQVVGKMEAVHQALEAVQAAAVAPTVEALRLVEIQIRQAQLEEMEEMEQAEPEEVLVELLEAMEHPAQMAAAAVEAEVVQMVRQVEKIRRGIQLTVVAAAVVEVEVLERLVAMEADMVGAVAVAKAEKSQGLEQQD